MLANAKEGLINLILVKDMSRIGRNHLLVGALPLGAPVLLLRVRSIPHRVGHAQDVAQLKVNIETGRPFSRRPVLYGKNQTQYKDL